MSAWMLYCIAIAAFAGAAASALAWVNRNPHTIRLSTPGNVRLVARTGKTKNDRVASFAWRR